MNYSIAYRDINGNDANGKPLVMILGEVDFESAYEYAEAISAILSSVILFNDSYEKVNDMTWDFVNSNAIQKFN